MVTLNGNVRPEAGSGADLSAVDDAMPLTHLQLQLKRSPEREAALKQYIDDLQTPRSASYHQWLTPEQFASHYGVAAEDVEHQQPAGLSQHHRMGFRDRHRLGQRL